MSFYGYGYHYPSLEGQPLEEYTYTTKRGTRTKRYPKSTPEWEAVYELNRQQAENNSWIKVLKSKVPALKEKYYAEKAKKNKPKPKIIVEELVNAPSTSGSGLKGLKTKYYASKISPDISKLSKDELLKINYGNRAPRKRRKALPVPAPVVEK
jgi:hypothetical protein